MRHLDWGGHVLAARQDLLLIIIYLHFLDIRRNIHVLVRLVGEYQTAMLQVLGDVDGLLLDKPLVLPARLHRLVSNTCLYLLKVVALDGDQVLLDGVESACNLRFVTNRIILNGLVSIYLDFVLLAFLYSVGEQVVVLVRLTDQIVVIAVATW